MKKLIDHLKIRGGYVSEQDLCRLYPAKAHLVPTVLAKLMQCRYVDVRLGGEGRAFKLNKTGRAKLTTKRTVSSFPPPSLRLTT